MARMASALDADDGDHDHAAEVLCVELKLTRRQAQVLHWMAQGKTNGEIATILACSFFTVKTHTKEIFERLGVHNRTGAAACAYRAHLRFLTARLSPERAIPRKRRSR
jgi:DNA-binding NarL/FixJ family response regulator